MKPWPPAEKEALVPEVREEHGGNLSQRFGSLLRVPCKGRVCWWALAASSWFPWPLEVGGQVVSWAYNELAPRRPR